MLKTIIEREILEYLKSSRFFIGLCLTVILVGMSTFINIGDYLQRQQDYLDAIQLLEDPHDVMIFRKPQIFSILVQGKDRELGNSIEINIREIPMQTSGYMGAFASQHYRYIAGFSAVDFAFVVRVVLSLMVIFLGYNSINQERVQGTLKLILANALPRGKLLWGKFLAGFIVILISLTIAVLVALLIMVLHPGISVDQALYLRIMAMWGISALYLGVFFALSLLVSVMVRSPSTALLILLQIWIVFIVIYPNVSVILSDHITKLSSREELNQRKNALFGPFEQEYEQARKANRETFDSREFDTAIMIKNVDVQAKRTNLFHQVDCDYSRQLTHQVHLAQHIAILSPSVLYDSVMKRLACTDIYEYDAFMQGVERHWHKLVERERKRYKYMLSNKKADKLPAFTYQKQYVAEAIVQTRSQWIILFLLAVVFFAMAHTIFLRKDVT